MSKDVINLIAETIEKDEIGQDITATSKREVFAEKKGITRTEFFNVGQTGIKPAFMFRIRAIDYEGEEIIEYEEKQYKVYRTYSSGEMMELYCEKRGGVHG